MFRPILLLCGLPLFLAGAAAAQTGSQPDFSADRFRAEVAFLSSDLLEGRDTGSRGHEIAASYVASQFEALGLQPGGEDGSWYQWVPLRTATFGSGPARVSISGPTGTRSWINGSDVIIGPSVFARQQDISAPVVFVGYGIDAPKDGADDYRGLDVRGKIVAVLAGAPADIPSELAAHFVDQKYATAARHGAIGFISLPTASSEESTPWTVRLRYLGRPKMTWVAPDGEAFVDAPGLVAGATLNGPAAEALFAGGRRSYAAVRAEAARNGAHPRGFALATRIRIERTSDWTDIRSPEVIGILPGADPKLRDEYVILMGHLDHLGIKRDAEAGEDAIFNGTLDNAAGVATMLEAARAFTRSGDRPRRSVMFIANTAEEKGLLGADYYAHQPTVPIDRIAAVVDLDMPLLLYDFTDVIAFGAEHSTVAQTVARAAGSIGVALSPDPMPEENIFVRSDHYMFVKQGVPAILLATGFANGGEAKWKDFLANTYHDVDDDMKQPIVWSAGAKYARLNYLISRELADADARPLWYKGDFFGNLYAPKAPKAPVPPEP
jgi:Zn-dependent M28 family amino/carboxypeptidase